MACADVERPEIDEADVLQYFDQAIALRHAIVFLRSHPACRLEGTQRPLDIVRTESLAARPSNARPSAAALVRAAPVDGDGAWKCVHRRPACASLWAYVRAPHLAMALAVLVLAARPWLCRCCCQEAIGFAWFPLRLACTHVLVSPWNAEPIVTTASNLLSIAAELLLRAPLLIQEYVSTQPNRAPRCRCRCARGTRGARLDARLTPATDSVQ